jgi:hypothetical protein
MFLLAHKI